MDEDTIIQSYNYREEFIDYVAKRSKKYSFDLAENFSRIKTKRGKSKILRKISKAKKRRLQVQARKYVLCTTYKTDCS